VDPHTGQLRRDVFIRVIQDGELRVPVPEEMIEWAAQQLELEEFLKALEEEKENEAADEAGGRR
jgi:MOSC domain-containing protein YiiM